jgi:sugar fermentation stimulation protein A
MKFPVPLVRGQLIRRYKRFFADVVLDDGTEITAHCPNPGAMLGLNLPDVTVWLSKSPDSKRKLAYTWELVEVPGEAPDGFVTCGVNTLHPNRLVAEALAAGTIPELAGYPVIRREVKYGEKSRVDFVLEGDDRCWVEVKGVTLSRQPGLAEWPDCVSARGARHVAELEAMVASGDRAVVLFVAQRDDCDRFALAGDLDPTFATALKGATGAGVEVLAYGCAMSTEAITLTGRLPY